MGSDQNYDIGANEVTPGYVSELLDALSTQWSRQVVPLYPMDLTGLPAGLVKPTEDRDLAEQRVPGNGGEYVEPSSQADLALKLFQSFLPKQGTGLDFLQQMYYGGQQPVQSVKEPEKSWVPAGSVGYNGIDVPVFKVPSKSWSGPGEARYTDGRILVPDWKPTEMKSIAHELEHYFQHQGAGGDAAWNASEKGVGYWSQAQEALARLGSSQMTELSPADMAKIRQFTRLNNDRAQLTYRPEYGKTRGSIAAYEKASEPVRRADQAVGQQAPVSVTPMDRPGGESQRTAVQLNVRKFLGDLVGLGR